MKDDQKDIYFLLASSRDTAEQSPYLKCSNQDIWKSFSRLIPSMKSSWITWDVLTKTLTAAESGVGNRRVE